VVASFSQDLHNNNELVPEGACLNPASEDGCVAAHYSGTHNLHVWFLHQEDHAEFYLKKYANAAIPTYAMYEKADCEGIRGLPTMITLVNIKHLLQRKVDAIDLNQLALDEVGRCASKNVGIFYHRNSYQI